MLLAPCGSCLLHRICIRINLKHIIDLEPDLLIMSNVMQVYIVHSISIVQGVLDLIVYEI